MFWVTRIFELLSATKRLNDSKAHVMNAVSGLIMVLLLGMFGTFMLALMISGLLYLLCTQLVLAGVGVLTATLGTTALALIILAAACLWAKAIFGRVHDDIDQVFHSQSPIVAPVINKVGDVASSFFSGLRTPRVKPAKAVERTRR